jgi:hypothetical protein
MTNPDFVLLAKAMGVHAIRCSNVEELPAKMKEFLEYDESKPVLLECVVERNEHVYPMVRSCLRSILPFTDSSIGASRQGTARTSSPPYLETKNEIRCLNLLSSVATSIKSRVFISFGISLNNVSCSTCTNIRSALSLLYSPSILISYILISEDSRNTKWGVEPGLFYVPVVWLNINAMPFGVPS